VFVVYIENARHEFGSRTEAVTFGQAQNVDSFEVLDWATQTVVYQEFPQTRWV
jgi:hypothetical protein